MEVRLSVIMPTRNIAPYVEAAIGSVLGQSMRDIELIVIDDSTDETRDLLHRIAEQHADPRLKILHGPNRGLGAARNVGIKAAQGEYIGFCDGDDLWNIKKAELHVTVLDNNPNIGITFSAVALIGLQYGVTMPHITEPSLYDVIRGSQIGMPTVITRRECFNVAGLFNDKLTGCEDWEMWCRIMHSTNLRTVLIPEVLSVYRQRSGSLSREFSNAARGADAAVTSVRAKMPEVPSHIISEGHGEHYRNIVWVAATTGYRWQATRYLATAIYHYFPWSIRKKSGVIASLIAAILVPPSIFAKIQQLRGRAA